MSGKVETPLPGITQWETKDGIVVIRVHYSADPDKDPATPEGKKWLDNRLVGYPGGVRGHAWRSEMEIDFSVFHGKPIYPTFVESIYVASSNLIPIKGVPMLRGWDAGLTPACAFSQLVPGPRWLIFPCLHSSGREGVGMTRFAKEVIEYSNIVYPGFRFIDHGDPAMFQRSQVDERTCSEILGTFGVDIIPGEVGSQSRDEKVRAQLERMIDGKPLVRVCPTARFMINGFKGGFQYVQIGQTGIYTKDHVKNEYSHPHEALQYTASCIFAVNEMATGNQDRHRVRGISNWLKKPR
jgi:hypothetical protein